MIDPNLRAILRFPGYEIRIAGEHIQTNHYLTLDADTERVVIAEDPRTRYGTAMNGAQEGDKVIVRLFSWHGA